MMLFIATTIWKFDKNEIENELLKSDLGTTKDSVTTNFVNYNEIPELSEILLSLPHPEYLSTF